MSIDHQMLFDMLPLPDEAKVKLLTKLHAESANKLGATEKEKTDPSTLSTTGNDFRHRGAATMALYCIVFNNLTTEAEQEQKSSHR